VQGFRSRRNTLLPFSSETLFRFPLSLRPRSAQSGPVFPADTLPFFLRDSNSRFMPAAARAASFSFLVLPLLVNRLNLVDLSAGSGFPTPRNCFHAFFLRSCTENYWPQVNFRTTSFYPLPDDNGGSVHQALLHVPLPRNIFLPAGGVPPKS